VVGQLSDKVQDLKERLKYQEQQVIEKVSRIQELEAEALMARIEGHPIDGKQAAVQTSFPSTPGSEIAAFLECQSSALEEVLKKK